MSPQWIMLEPPLRGVHPARGAKDETRPPVCLTIAGFDPSSGAGMTADLKTFAAHGVYGVAAITSLTVQSTQGVRSVHPLEPRLLRETLECLTADVQLAGIKIGMMATAGVAVEVDGLLRRLAETRPRIVLDPVMRSSSGSALLDEDGVDFLRNQLLEQAGWITPNLDELALLTGREAHTVAQVPAAAQELARLAREAGNPSLAIVVTGGHLDRPDDYLLLDGEGRWLHGERVETRSTHGTGCAFSSALLASLVRGLSGEAAVVAAKRYVTMALRQAYLVGQGNGPMHHLFALDRMPD